MPSLKEVRTRIRTVKSTQQITKAMKMVAASKLRKAQDAIIQLRPFSEKLCEILQNAIRSTEDGAPSQYAEKRDIRRILVVPVTSDKGLCGAFNSTVIKKTIALIEEDYEDTFHRGELFLMPVGIKGYDFFSKRGYNVIEDYRKIFTKLSFETVKEAADDVMRGFLNQDYDTVILVYNEFKNIATQVLCVDTFLPIPDSGTGEAGSSPTDYIFEPSKIEIKKKLVPQSLRIQFYKAILESNASEHGARMTAMEVATENAEELLGELQILYNRTRQAAITKEILDIVGGAEALASQ